MKYCFSKRIATYAALGILLALGVCTTAAWALESVSSVPATYDTYLSRLIQFLKTNFNRATWDSVMRWVNFLILVAVIFKYARAPVIDFLNSEQAEKARTLELIDQQKHFAEEKLKSGRRQLHASQERLKRIRQRIVSEGKRRKEQMIAAAEQESRILLSSTSTKIDGQIQEASRRFRAQMIEAAADQAMTKLPDLMTRQDHERMIGHWFEASHKYSPMSS